MSFNVPRNVPTFEDPRRRYEDVIWSSSGRSRFASGENGHAQGVADRLGGMFASGGDLPMYKDKPYYSSSRRRRWYKRKRVLASVLSVVLVALYWFGLFSSSDSKPGASRLWQGGFSPRPSGVVDWDERREAVRDAFKLSWSAYEEHGWGYDEYHPVSKKGRHMVEGGMGWIIVDALDTLILMNLTTELEHARTWVSKSLTYEKDHDVNTFETTIRMLGGLLAAHYLSTTFPNMAPVNAAQTGGDDLYLERAADLASRLLGAYESPSGVPYASINLKTMQGIKSHVDGGASSTAEATSLQLEMKYLAKLTGETHFWEAAENVMKVVDDNGAKDGLVPIFIYADNGHFRDKNIRLGSRGDSYYEYLIKQYLQTSKEEPIYREMWDQTVAGIKKHLITYSSPSNLTVLGERPSGLSGSLSPKMDHLVCFMPGTIALAVTGGKTLAEAMSSTEWGSQQEEDMELARQLMKTCWGMYKVTETGLAPEIAHFNMYSPPHMMEEGTLHSPDVLDPAPDAEWKQDYIIKSADRHNLQRPETVESLLYMWRITGDPMYREWGWEMFQSFIIHTAVPHNGGFTSVSDVTRIPPPSRDNMESFWLAETLKYFYLLFGPDDVLPLDQIVLNTEAHPFPQFSMGPLFKTGWERKPRDAEGNIIQNTVRSELSNEDSNSGSERVIQTAHVTKTV
ncbi:family 47 glycosyl hydrolase [Lineolata rhizophorae]|uniref:alpha-1,2-Mannosidase n=1 Tax=Lineolata rhizophorae TaxID=578093 RepID=A0A6A6NYR1_9PEZI|nr:family 47 glycosyl hydrolase [Lineolata rhizophorae]